MIYIVVAIALIAFISFVAGRWTAPADPELDRIDEWRARLRETAEPKQLWWHHHVHPSLGQTLVMSIESPAPDPYAALAEPVPDYVEGIEVGTRHEGRHRAGVALGTTAQRDPVCARQQQSVHTCWMETTPSLRAPWEIDTAALNLEYFGLLDYARSTT